MKPIIFSAPKVAGFIENTCKKCGKKFRKAYFEDESPEKGKGDYCLPCIFGVELKGQAEGT